MRYTILMVIFVIASAYTGPFGVVLLKNTTLQVQAIAVDECGAASKIVKEKYDCSGKGLTTSGISHWFDFLLPSCFKKAYDDAVYEDALLPKGPEIMLRTLETMGSG